MGEIFDENCPYYMSIGMSYDEYWYGNPYLVVTYTEAYNYKRKQINQQLWLQGLYFAHAVASNLDTTKKTKYPKEPFDIYPKTKAEKQAELEKQRRAVIEYFNQYMERWNNGDHKQS